MCYVDSPGLPPSANAHELFREFSFIASGLLDDNMNNTPDNANRNLSSSPSSSSTILQASTPIDIKPTPERFYSIIGTSNIQDDYEFKEEIAKGAYALVRRCIHRMSRVEHAVKIVTKGKRDWHDEVDILLRHSQHPHIVSLYTVSYTLS